MFRVSIVLMLAAPSRNTYIDVESIREHTKRLLSDRIQCLWAPCS